MRRDLVKLGEMGQAVWADYGADKLTAGDRALVRELARCVDTLDRLADLASGRREAWAELVFDDMGEVHLQVDKLLDEQRKTQMVLRGLYAELRQAGIKPTAQQDSSGTADQPGKPTPPEDVLAKRRKEREERERRLG